MDELRNNLTVGARPAVNEPEILPNERPSRIDFIGEGLAITKAQEDDLRYIGNFFQAIYRQNSSSRNAYSMLRGAMFSLGSKNYNNPE